MKFQNLKRPATGDADTLVGDVLDLRALCLVIDGRSLTAAARVMGESKATLSRRIARLERSLDVALVRRSPRLVEATEEGMVYRERAGRILELLGEANAAVRHTRSAASGHLRVTAPTDVAVALLAPPIADFSKRYPDVLVEVVLTGKVLDFDADHIDVAVRATGGGLPSSQLIAHKLLGLEVIAVASPAYLVEHPAPARPEDLARHRLTMMGSPRERTVTLRRAGGDDVEVRVRPILTASEPSFAKEVALAGGGIALVPAVLAKRDLDEGRLLRVLAGYVTGEGALYLLHRGGRLLPPKVRVFRDFMLDAFAARAGRKR